jgi:hypothetical protein
MEFDDGGPKKFRIIAAIRGGRVLRLVNMRGEKGGVNRLNGRWPNGLIAI